MMLQTAEEITEVMDAKRRSVVYHERCILRLERQIAELKQMLSVVETRPLPLFDQQRKDTND